MKKIDQKLEDIAQMKKILNAKLLLINNQLQTKIDSYQKYFKYLKKEIKDHKVVQYDIIALSQGVFQQFDELLRQCYWEYKLKRTDFQSLFVKLKFNQESNKKPKFNLDQIINYESKIQKSILMNCKTNLLSEIRGQIQYFDSETLIQKSHQILIGLPYFNTFKQNQTNNLKVIVQEICKNYNILPFHNFTHGFGVFLSFYCLTQDQCIKQLIDDFTLFFVLIACLSHDIQHQGNNTLFQVKINSNLSIQFGKFSVLEKMHLQKTLEILTKRQNTKRFFETLQPEDQIKARKIISKSILATDMSKHYQYVNLMTQKQINKNCSQYKELLIETLVHACDIENPSLQFQSYMYWAHLVCIQFHEQTIKQQDWQVEITEYLKFQSLTYFYKNQMTFTNSVVLPLWQTIQNKFPSLEKRQYVKKIKKNISILSQALRRNSQPNLSNKSVQKYVSYKLSK